MWFDKLGGLGSEVRHWGPAAKHRRGCGLRSPQKLKPFSELFAVARPSVVCLSAVVCNVRAPYSGSSNFRQYFYGVQYLGHPLTSTENFTEIVPGERLRRGS